MSTRPSVLFFMCDQLNASVLGCYGGPVPTPSIDRLAREGVLFDNAVCPTPFCSPSRASIVTGLYPHTHGITANCMRRDYPHYPMPPGVPHQVGIRASDVTTESLLHARGYETHFYGKWHLLEDDLPYFPDMFLEHGRHAEGMADTFAAVRRRPREEWMNWYGWALPVTVAPRLREAIAALGDRWRGKTYAEFITKMGRLDLPLEQNFDVQVANRTVEALQGLHDKPFMITCSFNYPHDPNVVPSPYYEMFDPDHIELPANFVFREARFEQEWSRQIVSDLGEAATREFLRIYYASVRLVDDQVGRALAALDASGRSDDTIIVFTADHSDMAGGHGMVWKSTSAFYDEVARVPLIIRYPRRIRPGRSAIAANLTDLMPTLLEFAAEPVPSHVQGHSLAPYLRGERDASQAPQYAFCERVGRARDGSRTVQPGAPGSFMVRGSGWKYVRYANRDEYLYDLTNDPGETRSLAKDAPHQVQLEHLRSALDEWLVRTRYPGR